MIDWDATGKTADTIRTLDKVVVTCEKCLKSRQITYNNAKKLSEHICMSCRKRKDLPHKTGDIVTYRCKCGTEKQQKYVPKRFENWLCHHCAMVKGHADGKFVVNLVKMTDEVREKIGIKAKGQWENQEFREKFSEQRKETKEKRSQISREIWADEDRLKKLSDTLNSPDCRERRAISRASQPRISSLQIQLYQYLDDLKISYHKEGIETTIGYYAFDCLIPSTNQQTKNILIECQGDYWHSLDKVSKNDRAKFTYIDRYFPNHEIMYIWEHEFSTENRVLDRLKLKLGMEIETVNFDLQQLVIKTPDVTDLKKFLDAYHYIGKERGGQAFGIYHHDKLIACIVYSPPLRQNTAGQFDLADADLRELSRLCIHPSYHKKNLASWLIAKTMKLLPKTVKAIIAYSDRTVGHTGTIYKASNFVEHHRVPPDYWYADENGYIMHKRTLYGKAVKMSMIEADYAAKYGYVKVWGGDKLCFLRTIR